MNKKEEKSHPGNRATKLLHLFRIFLPACIILLVFNVMLQIGTIASDSMNPTLQTGNYTITNRLSYVIREPQRGDVITFTHNDERLVKRIIGLPGETISFTDGYVYINNKLLVEPYIATNTETNSVKSFKIPDNSYFVLGDNRELSEDSRYWESAFIPDKAITGRVFFTFSFSQKKATIINRMNQSIIKAEKQ